MFDDRSVVNFYQSLLTFWVFYFVYILETLVFFIEETSNNTIGLKVLTPLKKRQVI